MKKEKIEEKLRAFIKDNINPSTEEINLVKRRYSSVKQALGEGNCFRIGSWPRGTAIHPLHDLDILFVAGDSFNIDTPPNPAEVIKETAKKIKDNLEVPAGYSIEIDEQSHSCTILYKNSKGEIVFSIDVVPGYIAHKNDQNQDMYFIPEVNYLNKKEQTKYYTEIQEGFRKMGWRLSDPRGYIEPTKELWRRNKDFRLAVKFIKAWKHFAKETNGDDFKLKSFHLEQKLFKYYSEHTDHSLFDGIFLILTEMSVYSPFFTPSILDRAPNNEDPYIDSYLRELSIGQKELIQRVRDYTMINLENITESSNIQQSLLSGNTYLRPISEKFLFDSNKRTFTEDLRDFKIIATVRSQGNRNGFILDENNNTVERDRNINFSAKYTIKPMGSKVLWKVRNDYEQEPRGEITPNKTRNDPEHTKYLGHHYVEAYLMHQCICIEKYKQPVIIIENEND